MDERDFPYMTEAERRRFERDVRGGLVTVVSEDEIEARWRAGGALRLDLHMATERLAERIMGLPGGELKRRRDRGWAPPHLCVDGQAFYYLPDVLARMGGGHG